jgi:membrane-bound metal-dependent hydrolase YbcI (DUF457 family)
MTHPVHSPRTASLGRVVGVDVALVVVTVAAVLLSFLTGQDVPRWRNLVFAPVVFLLAALALRLVVAEVRAVRPVLPVTSHKGEALAALGVAIAAVVVVLPMVVIMPIMFLTGL